MMHTIAKASLQANSRVEMFRTFMKIDVKMSQNELKFGPWRALGPFRASGITRKLQKHPKRDPKGTQGRPLGAPGEAQERPRLPKERPEGAQERSWEVSGGPKSRESGSPRRKKSILAKMLRDSALPMRGALWTP